jgi:hypothetical protein
MRTSYFPRVGMGVGEKLFGALTSKQSKRCLPVMITCSNILAGFIRGAIWGMGIFSNGDKGS